MPRYKITKSLIESWYYVHDCWEGCEEDAYNSFLHALRCEPDELTDEQKKNIQSGHTFERLVEAIATGEETFGMIPADPKNPREGLVPLNIKDHRWYRAANEIAQLVKGSQFQIRITKPITVNGIDFEIHGVLDALREGTIFDFKFRNKSFGSLDLAGSYLGSAQHPFYFYLVPEARDFLYLVSDGTDIYIERYTPEDSRSAEDVIIEFVSFLTSSGLMDEYRKHWQI